MRQAKVGEAALRALSWTSAANNLLDLVTETEGRNNSYIAMVLSQDEASDVAEAAAEHFDAWTAESVDDFHRTFAQTSEAATSTQSAASSTLVAVATPANVNVAGTRSTPSNAVIRAQQGYAENAGMRAA